MEDFVEQLSRGNVEEVKVVLASAVAALAIYKVLLMAIGYRKLRLPFLASRPASSTHRAVGDTIVVITSLTSFMCISYFGFEDGDSDEENARPSPCGRRFGTGRGARFLRSRSSGGGTAWAASCPRSDSPCSLCSWSRG